MSSPRLSLDEIEVLVYERLRFFYDRRVDRIRGLTLHKLLSKNVYLFRAKGLMKSADLVSELMESYLIKSDETIFGKVFFEEIAKAVGNAEEAHQVGMDLVIETDQEYMVIEIKSGANWQNARMGRGLRDDFNKAFDLYQERGITKEFVAILGQSCGQKNTSVSGKYKSLILSGQAFWEKITGDSDFYLKLTRLMKDYPVRLRPDYQEAKEAALNKLDRQFLSLYVDQDGFIDWEKLIARYNGRDADTLALF